MANPHTMAQALGRRGGQARARRLSPADRRRIAALGGEARRRSLEIARRIVDNFNYLRATDELRGCQPSLTRVKTCQGPLPGLYPDRS